MPDLNADLDWTIATLQQDLGTVAPKDAIAILDNWQDHFQGHNLAADLEQLKHAIGNSDTQASADILGAVGEDTTGETASRSVDEFEAKIKQLGALLSQVSETLQS